MSFLKMFCVVAALAAKNHRAGEFRMPELLMRTFPAWNNDEFSLFQVSDQLANLARHTRDPATGRRQMRASIRLPSRNFMDGSLFSPFFASGVT
jgi:hypothetical protein